MANVAFVQTLAAGRYDTGYTANVPGAVVELRVETGMPDGGGEFAARRVCAVTS